MKGMRPSGLVPVALILLVVLLGFPRPFTGVLGGAPFHRGLRHFVLAAEPVDESEAPTVPAFSYAPPVYVPVAVGAVLLILRARRNGYVRVTVHRLRVPFRKSSRSLLPD